MNYIISSNAMQEKARQASARSSRGSIDNSAQEAAGIIIDQRVAPSIDGGSPGFQVRLAFFNREPPRPGAAGAELWYALAYPADVVVQLFGNSVVGRHCSLHYRTATPEHGVVFITGAPYAKSDIETALTLPAIGTVFAPAGQ